MTLRPTRPDSSATVRRYRPPIGIPETGEYSRVRGLVGSLGVHLLLVLLFIVPYVVHEVINVRERREGMGDGQSGGGGGGTAGSGALTTERLYYVPITPAQREIPTPAITPPPPPPPVPTPVLEPPRPVLPPPVAPPTPVQPPASPPAAAPTEVPAAATSGGATMGDGGGTGRDGSAGSGSGSGGGIGSGVGTGRGSGAGPGTGAGTDSIHPPTLVTLALPPLDAPRKLRPYLLVAYFDVDERGGTKLIGFNETSDAGFNRKVRAVLGEVRFRAAVRADGRPVRDTGRFEIEYP